MDTEVIESLFSAIEAHNKRLNKVEASIEKYTKELGNTKSYLEKKIDLATKELLTKIIQDKKLTTPIVNNKVDVPTINNNIDTIDYSDLIKEIISSISVINNKENKVDITVDTASMSSTIAKALEDSNKQLKVLLTELINKDIPKPDVTINNDINSIKVNRDNSGSIESLDIVRK